MTIEELQKIRAQQAQKRARIYEKAKSGMPNPQIALEEGLSTSRISAIVRSERKRELDSK